MSTVISRLLKGQLIGNALSLYAVQGLNYLMPLLMLPFLLRALKPEGYGAIMFAQSLVGYAIILTEFGFNFTATRDISIARHDPREVARIFWTTMAAKTLLLLVSFVVIGLVVFLTPSFKKDWPVFAASALLLVGNVALPQWYFQGLEKLKEVALIQAISKCLVSASVILLVRSPQDVVSAAVILSAPQLIGVAAALILGKSPAPREFYEPSWNEIKAALKGSWDMFAASVSTTLYLHTNTFVLGLMAGEQAVGLYSLGGRLIATVQGLIGPISQAVFPRASILFATRPDQGWILLKRVAVFLLPGIGVVSLLMGMFAPTIVMWLGGKSYAGASNVVRIIAVVPTLVATATILAQIVMVNIGLTKQLGRIYFAVGVLNLAILPVLIWKFAATGAATALVIAETLGPVFMGIVLWRNRNTLGFRQAHTQVERL